MKKFFCCISNIISGLFIIWILILLFLLLLVIISDINTIIVSGFSMPNMGGVCIGIMALLIGLSMLIPPLREKYYSYPWLYAYVKIFFFDLIILCIAQTIINYGYEVQSQSRHILFIILMVVQIILCRIIMCLYLNKRKCKNVGDGSNG